MLAEVETQHAPDLLVVTGDLVSRRRAEAYSRLSDELIPFAGRLRVLPGNHDSRRLLRAAFGDLLQRVGSAAVFRVELGGWRLLGLDSVRRPFVHAKFGRRQLDWLAAELRAVDRPVLAFVHHPPARVGTWWLDKDLARDRRRLRRVVEATRLQAFVCGHVHQPYEGTFAGVRVWTTPAVAYQFAPGSWVPRRGARAPGYRVLELRADGGIRSQVVMLAD